MTNPWDDDADVDVQDQQTQRNPLRDVVKSLETKNAEKDKRLDALETALRERDVRDILGEVGADKRVVKFIPATVEATPDAVKAWWEENKDVFAGTSTSSTDAPAATSDEPAGTIGAPEVDRDTQAQWARISRVSQAPGTSVPDQAAQAELYLKGAQKAANGDPNAFREFLQGIRPIPS